MSFMLERLIIPSYIWEEFCLQRYNIFKLKVTKALFRCQWPLVKDLAINLQLSQNISLSRKLRSETNPLYNIGTQFTVICIASNSK